MFGLTVFGNKTTSVALVEHLIANDVKVDLVVTLRPGATKATISGQADVASFCSERGITCYGVESYSLRSAEDQAFFAANKFDLGLCTGWQRLIPGDVLARFDAGVFGWHGSLFPFPNGRGRSPLNWSIRLGGAQVHHNAFRYAPGADDGPVFDTRVIPIEGDYIADLQSKALDHIKVSAVDVARAHRDGSLAGRLRPQPPGASVHFPKLSESDGEIFPDRMSVVQIENLVRSCSRPFPGAFVREPEGILRIWRCRPAGLRDGSGPLLHAIDGDLVVTEWEREAAG